MNWVVVLSSLSLLIVTACFIWSCIAHLVLKDYAKISSNIFPILCIWVLNTMFFTMTIYNVYFN